jgi:gliding motility-associated-like protein
MVKKRLSSFRLSFSSFIFVLALLYSFNSKAQCAGQDNTIAICDIPNPTSQTINLFALLGGTPTAGGTWTDDDLSGGLNTTTGVLNAQLVNQSGIYNYTYTVTGDPSCVDNTATITVTIGGYAGVTGPNASVCSSTKNFNLFQVFNGSSLSPQSNGTWHNDTSNTTVGSIIDAGSLVIGTNQFTYTMAAVGTCPAVSSTAFLTVYRAPNSGIASGLFLCSNDDLSIYTNLDLNSYLTGEDTGGRWFDNNGTGQITSLLDHNINVQSIYNTFGVGIYSFTYAVPPSNPICSPSTSTVIITIEKRLDFTGATLVVTKDICESEISSASYTATITQGIDPIANGLYNVTYQVSGPNGGIYTISANFNNGTLSFPISASNFQQPNVFTITINNIKIPTDSGLCTSIINNLNDNLTIFPLPKLNGATLITAAVCKNDAAQVNITGASGLGDGSYNIVYNLSGANTALAQTATITVVGGVSSFTIPAGSIPNLGTTIVTITNITNNTTGCTNTANVSGNVVVKPLPDITNLAFTVKSVCLGQPVVVNLTGLGTLTTIDLSYDISGVNTVPTQVINLTVTAAGTASFTIAQGSIPNIGVSSINLTNLVNAGNLCSVPVNLSNSFTNNDLPLAPAAVDQSFCKTANATVASLLPNGTQYQWFDSLTATAPLASTTVLNTKSYYVRIKDPITGCESPFTTIAVTINALQTPTLNPDGEQFCGLDKPTLQNLSNNTNVPSNIKWYDAPSGGNLLPNTTLLVEGSTYYGFNSATTNTCLSAAGLAVTVSLINCKTPLDFYIPDGFSPNDDGINDTYSIPKIDFTYPNYTIEIYNRYGNLLFEGNRNKPNWDGKSSDGAGSGVVPNGVYFYVINFNNKDNKAPVQGRLYLNR